MTSRVQARLPGIVIAALGVPFCVGALSYGVVNDGRMGPGLMPMVSGLGLVVLGTLIAVTARPEGRAVTEGNDLHRGHVLAGGAVGGGAAGGVAATEGEPVEDQLADDSRIIAQQVQHPRRPWLILTATAAALLVAPAVGLIPGLGAMALVLLRFVERESWRLTVAVTAALVVASWLVFEVLLNLNLPWGVFGGLM